MRQPIDGSCPCQARGTLDPVITARVYWLYIGNTICIFIDTFCSACKSKQARDGPQHGLLQRSFLRLVKRSWSQYLLQMKSESKHSTGKTAEKQPRGLSQGAGDGKAVRAHAAVTSSVSKPEFKKHIHTNATSTKPDESASSASGAVLSRRQIKNLAKRRKKEAAAAASAAGNAASATSSSLTPNSSDHASSSGGNAPASAKAKKAPLDPGKKAEVNCNWQALKKALVSGGPVITRSGAMPKPSTVASAVMFCS
jgi:hypothetical protein